MFFLPTDRRRLPVARIDYGFIRKGPQPIPDAAQQGSVIAAGQVRPPDASPEQYIASDQKPSFPVIESDAPRRMSREEKDLQPVLIQIDRPARNKESKLSPVVLERHPPLQTHRRRQGQHGLLLLVEMKRQVPRRGDEVIPEHVIQVTMGVQKQFRA